VPDFRTSHARYRVRTCDLTPLPRKEAVFPGETIYVKLSFTI